MPIEPEATSVDSLGVFTSSYISETYGPLESTKVTRNKISVSGRLVISYVPSATVVV
jgi:hypothetical protein